MARNRIKRQAWKLVRKMRAQAKDRRYEAKTRTSVVRLVSLQKCAGMPRYRRCNEYLIQCRVKKPLGGASLHAIMD